MNTEILTITGSHEDEDILEHAAELIDSGELVVFPTETVYGIAASVTTGGLEKLNALKDDRDREKHYSLHLPSPSEIRNYVPKISLRSYKLAYNILPGPATLIFDVAPEHIAIKRQILGTDAADTLYKDGTIGIRCPDSPVASKLLNYTDSPVVATSANPSGQQPAVNAQQAYSYFDGKVAAVVDAGPCTVKRNSTVVKLSGFDPVILREGSITRDEIITKSTLRIMFVCSGNTCRSPMAEAFCKKTLANKLGCTVDRLSDFGYKVSSGGVMAPVAQPASPGCIEVCGEAGIDISGHSTAGLTEADIIECDLIYVMTKSEKQRITDFYPVISPKCKLLAGKRDVLDPIDGDITVYRHCAAEIIRALERHLEDLTL